jgi:hypothetical protein
MGIKFKPSEPVRQQDGTIRYKHHYMKAVPTTTLNEYLQANNAKPKIKAKVRNELARRESAISNS